MTIDIANEANQYHDIVKAEVKKRSDRLMDYFLIGYFIIGLILAGFYDTWHIALSIGSICLVAYFH